MLVKSKRTIKADVKVGDKVIAHDLVFPLYHSSRKGRYDIIYSLQQAPQLKAYKFSRITPGSYTLNLDTGVRYSELTFPAMGRESEVNLPTDQRLDVKEAMASEETHVYNKARPDEPRRDITITTYTLLLDNASSEQQRRPFKCVMCMKEAMIVHMGLNMPFCSDACWQPLIGENI